MLVLNSIRYTEEGTGIKNNPGYLLRRRYSFLSRGNTGVYKNDYTTYRDAGQLKVATFVYDEPALAALENSLSAERLTPYLDLAEKDRAYAIRLYEWNTRISESLYSLTQGLEITLRNRVNRVLCEAFAQENWWDICALATKQVSDIDEATKRIYYDGYDPVPNRIVAELMFGFWVSLFGTDYAQ